VLIRFTPRDLSYLMFKRRKYFMGAVATALVLYCVLVIPQKSQYESTSSIVVKVIDQDVAMPDNMSEQQRANASSSANMSKEVINSEQVIITSQDVLIAALTAVGVDKVYPDISARAKRAHLPVLNVAAEKLLTDISVKVNSESNVLMLSLFNTDPRIARKTLEALVAATVSKQAHVMRDPRLPFLEGKVAALKADADAAQAALLEFKRRTRITSFDDELGLLLRQRDATQASRNQIQADLYAATGRAKSLQEALDHTPHAIALSDENDRMQHQIDTARDRLTAAQSRYEAARQRFREGNPELLDQQAQLQMAEKEFNQLAQASNTRVRTGANPLSLKISGDFSTARSDTTASKAAIEERDKQLEYLDSRIAYLNANEAELRTLERRRHMADRDYQSYLERAQSARIVSDMNQAGITSLAVLQPATLPYHPARPKKLLLLLLALVCGVGGGFGLCLFLELIDDTITLPEQAEEVTGLPLLAVIDHQQPEGAQ
jgi:polysaccharide biosynthesis protein PslE